MDISKVVGSIKAGQPQPEQPRDCGQESKVMLRLWLRMTEMYGTLWTNSQGEEPNDTWTIALADLTPEQIGAGLTGCWDSGKPFPPTLPEFLGLCRVNDWEHARQSKLAHEVLSAPIIDKGEGRYLESPESARAREIGNPESNPNYFADLMRGIK